MVDLLKSNRDRILELARRHGVTRVRMFGSMARGDARPDSDVDLLVDVGLDPSAWFPGGLVAELEELLGRRLQIVTERGLDELLRDRVLQGGGAPMKDDGVYLGSAKLFSRWHTDLRGGNHVGCPGCERA